MSLSVGTLVRTLMPRGSNHMDVFHVRVSEYQEEKDFMHRAEERVPDWGSFPHWPPDLFGVTAYLLEKSSAYRFFLTEEAGTRKIRDDLEQFKEVAICWRTSEFLNTDSYDKQKQYLDELWSCLSTCEDFVVSSLDVKDWQIAALKLLIVADQACEGIGFPSSDRLWIGVDYEALRAKGSGQDPFNSQDMAASACINVTNSILCVQPKTRTAAVGYSIRSMSNHLAMLPSGGEVQAMWVSQGAERKDPGHSLNLMLIPFPYHIGSASFVPLQKNSRGFDSFRIEQKWLTELASRDFADFVRDLILEAQRDVETVDGIVLPELALNTEFLDALVRMVCLEPDIKLQFISTGLFTRLGNGTEHNLAATLLFSEDSSTLLHFYGQSKHHRWKLDRNQITQYSLGAALDPTREWWEGSFPRPREMAFFVFREGACFTTLVCEDLARTDPGQTVIRAIGPNLIIALLMDGPQLSDRWPGRYAMGLADDPGSSVVTLTSLGLIKRSNHHFDTEKHQIALWRDPGGYIKSLDLPRGSQALLLNLTAERLPEFSLDGRIDNEGAVRLKYSGCIPIGINSSKSVLNT